jgi:hypothetical protein
MSKKNAVTDYNAPSSEPFRPQERVNLALGLEKVENPGRRS